MVLEVSLPEHNFAAAKGRCFEKHNATLFFWNTCPSFHFFPWYTKGIWQIPIQYHKKKWKNKIMPHYAFQNTNAFLSFFSMIHRVSGRYPQLHITRKSEKKIYAPVGKPSPRSESTAWIFPSYFQLHYLPEETSFQQGGSFLPWTQISNHRIPQVQREFHLTTTPWQDVLSWVHTSHTHFAQPTL